PWGRGPVARADGTEDTLRQVPERRLWVGAARAPQEWQDVVDEVPEHRLPALALGGTGNALPGQVEGLLRGQGVKEQDVHAHPGLVTLVADRDGVQVPADEAPVQVRVVPDADRHREERDPVAAAGGPVPGERAGLGRWGARGDVAEQVGGVPAPPAR